MDEVYVTVAKVKGGFIVRADGIQEVVTSLNKTMKLVREALAAESEPAEFTELAE